MLKSIHQWHIYLGDFTGALLVLRLVRRWTGPTPIRHRTLFAAPGRRRGSGVPWIPPCLPHLPGGR